MPVVVGVLVVREQVLRDPHEDVEADGVAPVQGEKTYRHIYTYIYTQACEQQSKPALGPACVPRGREACARVAYVNCSQ